MTDLTPDPVPPNFDIAEAERALTEPTAAHTAFDIGETAQARQKAKATKAPEPIVRSIKATHADLTCNGYQFVPGQTHTHEGAVKLCSSGFHACPVEAHPLSVFGYYAPAGIRLWDVEQSGKIDGDPAKDDKVCSASITLKVEFSISDLVARTIKWVIDRATGAPGQHTTEDRSAASSTGYQSAASSTGDRSAASSTGYQSAASSTGDQSAASSTGDRSAASSTGDQSAASSTGYQSAASSTGDRSAASSTGDQSAASSTGDRSAASSTGYQSAASADGKHVTAIAHGHSGKAKASKTGAIFLVERGDAYEIKAVFASKVGENGIKPDTWYRLENGKPVEAAS